MKSADDASSIPVKEPGLATTNRSARLGWVDQAKGLGIILVVIGHALGGLIDSGTPLPAGCRYAFTLIYFFHMPLFFMMSGLFVAERVVANRAGFLRGVALNVVWPYFLWSTVQYLVIFMAGSMVNHPTDAFWPTVLALPYQTTSQFWFLHALFLLHMFAVLALPRFGPMLFALVCIGLKPFIMLVPLPVFVGMAVSNAPYYGIGAMLAAPGLAAAVADRAVIVRAVILPLLAAALLTLGIDQIPAWKPFAEFQVIDSASLAGFSWRLQFLPLAFAGTAATVGLGSLLKGRAGAVARYLGSRSMTIYVLHIMAIAGTRIIMSKIFHIDNVWLLLASVSIVGIILPLLAYAIARRLGINRILGLG